MSKKDRYIFPKNTDAENDFINKLKEVVRSNLPEAKNPVEDALKWNSEVGKKTGKNMNKGVGGIRG